MKRANPNDGTPGLSVSDRVALAVLISPKIQSPRTLAEAEAFIRRFAGEADRCLFRESETEQLNMNDYPSDEEWLRASRLMSGFHAAAQIIGREAIRARLARIPGATGP